MVWVVAILVGATAVALVVKGATLTGPEGTGGFTVGEYDKHIVDLAHAIATAEGYYVAGSVPQRTHNPGDLGPGDTGVDNVVHAVGSDVSVLAPDNDDAQGWGLLMAKLQRAVSGASHTYNPDMSFEDFAAKYVGSKGDYADEAAHIVAYLQGQGYDVDVNTTLRGYMSL